MSEQPQEPGLGAWSDALDRLGIPGHIMGVSPLSAQFSLRGPAFTLKYETVSRGGGSVGDYIDDVPPGAVVVIDNDGRLEATVWGDILTAVAHQRGVGGTVIDGVCRDISTSLGLGYPIYSRGSYMRTGKDRVQLEAMDVPVTIGGVRIEPGDLLIGGPEGVLAVPAKEVDDVRAAAEEIEEAEDRIREEVRGGASLREARERHGYMALQAKRSNR